MLRRMINYHDSILHRLPPETLATIAYYLPDNRSLIIATCVCHLWRSTLLSTPRLWSYLTFENEQYGLVLLARTGSVPVTVDLTGNRVPSQAVRGSLKRIVNRVITLRGAYSMFLDELLADAPPTLTDLDIIQSLDRQWKQTMRYLPSLKSLSITDLSCHFFHAPHLTNLFFKLTRYVPTTGGLENHLINLFQSCLLLEVIFLSYGYSPVYFGFMDGKAFVIHLPHLRSFTHESPSDAVHVRLFNRLSLPPACDVALAIKTSNTRFDEGPWEHGFPAPPEPSYLSDIKVVKITTDVEGGSSRITFKTELFSSKSRRVLFSVESHSSNFDPFSAVKQLLDFLESSGVARSIENLHFERYPGHTLEQSAAPDLTSRLQRFRMLKSLVLLRCNPQFFLWNTSPRGGWCPNIEKLVIDPLPLRSWGPMGRDVLEKVRQIAVSRHCDGNPLKTVILFFQDPKALLEESRELVEDLNGCVGSVQILESGS